MTVFRRGDNPVYHYQFMLGGVRYRGSTKETTLGKARKFESLLMGKIGRGEHEAEPGEIPSLRELSTRFLEFKEKQVASTHLAAGSLRNYQGGWKLLEKTSLADRPIDQITRSNVMEISFPGGPYNANMAIRTLRHMLSLAVEWKLMQAAPKLKTLKEIGRKKLIEPAQEELLLELAPQPLHDILIVAMDTGMRPEEAMRLRWENVLWERRAVLVPYGKTLGSTRYVPLADRLSNMLRMRQSSREQLFRDAWERPLSELARAYGMSDVGLAKVCRRMKIPLPGRGYWARKAAGKEVPARPPLSAEASPWIFPSERADGGHLTTVSKLWRETVARANERLTRQGLPLIPEKLVLYSARHTFATDMLKEMDVVKVSKLLGHADLRTTMKYLHPDTSDASDAVNRRNDKKRSLYVIKSA